MSEVKGIEFVGGPSDGNRVTVPIKTHEYKFHCCGARPDRADVVILRVSVQNLEWRCIASDTRTVRYSMAVYRERYEDSPLFDFVGYE